MPQEFYGIGRAIADVGDAFNQEISRYNALSPLRKNLYRAGGGAGLITFCLYIPYEMHVRGGVSAANMMSALVHAPMAPRETWIPVAAWAAMLAFGLLWFIVGVKGARGPRDVMQAFWALILTAIYAALHDPLIGPRVPPSNHFGFARRQLLRPKKSQPRNGAGEIFITAAAEIARETVSATNRFGHETGNPRKFATK
jgi:hypothetical protein